MATSGSKTVTVTAYDTLKFSWEESSQSIVNNTTTITWKLQLIASAAGGAINSSVAKEWAVTVHGNNYSGTNSIAISNGQTKTLASGTTTIPHNTDGTRTFSYSFYQDFGITFSGQWVGTKYGSGTGVLDIIARKATISGASDFNDLENPTLLYLNPAGEAVDTLQACISFTGGKDDIPYRDISKTGSVYTFNLTDAERQTLLNGTLSGSNQRAVFFYIKTVIGGNTLYSYVSKIFTVADAEPVISNVEIEDVNAATAALTGNPLSVVQGYSNISAKFAVTPQKGASMVSHSITCGSKSIDSNEGTLSAVDGDTVVYRGTDNRGLTTTWTVPVTLIRYIKLTCNLIATAPTTGGNSTLTVSGNYFNDSFGATNNALTIQYRYKANNDEYGAWITAAAATLNGNTYNIDVPVSDLNYLNKYTFQARAVDALNTIDSVERVVKTTPLFDWGENDFNFNVPVTFNGVPLADFVIEEGNDGLYAYRKWSSGLMEAWRSTNNSVTVSTTGTYGSVPYADGLELKTSGNANQFVSVESVNLSINKNGSMGFWQPVIANCTVANGMVTVQYLLTNPATASNIKLVPKVHIIGRWK